MPVISTLGRLRQEDHEFEAFLGNIGRKKGGAGHQWLTPIS
jgi:hypothetical protein